MVGAAERDALFAPVGAASDPQTVALDSWVDAVTGTVYLPRDRVESDKAVKVVRSGLGDPSTGAWGDAMRSASPAWPIWHATDDSNRQGLEARTLFDDSSGFAVPT